MKKIYKYSINEATKSFKGPWNPKDVAKVADKIFRVAKFKGKYGKGLHTHTFDEFFLILEGNIEINTESEKIRLGTLEGAIIPAGVKHQPFAKRSALVLMLDQDE
jgi:mannose-6-phosphate isomerase-like protein (cupin superfamily)